MASCPTCGKEISGTSAFCPSCGALLDRPDTSAAPPGRIDSPATNADAGRINSTATATAPAAVDDFGDIGQYIARRLFALIVDLFGVSVLLATGIGYLVARGGGDPHSYGGFFETAIYTLFALIVYKVLAESYLATTLGKALVGLRVRPASTDAPRVGIGRGLTRNIFLPFDLCVIGFVLAVITPRRRRIGDFVAGTEVVNAPRAALGAVVAIAIVGVWGYAEYAYGDGLRTAQTLSNTAATYGPSFLGSQGTPPPAPVPLPDRTAVPTEQPITVPTL
ncbi:MAG TPA: RDD family protein, partial [Candidatus Eremiobacteraceae bacterium]|nr:RDD family protein [Candidatus Eremiobacteraceae bacterium]